MNNIITKDARHNGVAKALYTISGSLEDFAALAPEAQADFIYEALCNVTSRTGKWGEGKKPKAPFDAWVAKGTVSFAEVAAMLATKGERSGGKPDKGDYEIADQALVVLSAEAKKRDEADPDGDYWEILKSLVEAAFAKLSAKYAESGGISWEWRDVEKEKDEKMDDHLKRQARLNIALLRKAERQAIERQTRKSSDLF